MIQCIEVTPDILLTAISLDDTDQLFTLVDKNRGHLRDWLPWLDFNTSVHDSVDFIERSRAQAEAKTGLVMLIKYQHQPVGIIGFNYIDTLHKVCEIGYWISFQHQGLGIVSKCTRRIIEYAFTELALNKVSIHIAVENTNSHSIPKKLGFKIEGISRQAEWLYDHYVDHVMYALLLSEWRAQVDV